MTKSAYYHFKNISRIKGLMSQQDFEKLVHAFIFSRLDYCDGVFTELWSIHLNPSTSCSWFKTLLQNQIWYHITLVLRSLHCLSNNTFQNPAVGLYSTEWLQAKIHFWSAGTLWTIQTLQVVGTVLTSVPKVRTKHGEAVFSYYAPNIWNELSENCRSAPTLTSFKSRLKTFLFATAFHWRNNNALNCTVTF